MKILLHLQTVERVKSFIEKINDFQCDIDAKYDRQIVDAKSFLGLLSLAHHETTIILHSDNQEDIKKFAEICEEFK